MKRYAIEVTHTPNSLNIWYPRGYQESYIRKGDFTVNTEGFFKDPALWPKYLYTSKKGAEKGMKIMQGNNSQGRYWDSSFRIVEIEIN